MKWTYGIQHKMTAALLLLLVFGLVLMNNIKESNNSEQLQDAITTMHDDRLLPESYILQFSAHLHKIIDILDNNQYSPIVKSNLIRAELSAIHPLNQAYRKTRLTKDEAVNFERFEHLCGRIEQKTDMQHAEIGRQSAVEALAVLHTLSGIQLAEARLVLTGTHRLYSMGVIFSKFEMAIVIVIAVLIQALVFSSKTLQTLPQNGNNLN